MEEQANDTTKYFSWLKGDSWVKSKIKNIKEFKSYLIKRGVPTCAGEFNNNWHGDIKYCPQCKETRVTDCCACGCGSCYTCGYRWCCTPTNIEFVDFSNVFSEPKYKSYQLTPLNLHHPDPWYKYKCVKSGLTGSQTI